MAAAHEQLPHLQVDHYMVSNIDAGGEGWPWVDALPEVCVPASEEGVFYPSEVNVPSVVHFCQGYRAGEFSYAKRRVPHDIFDCGHDMLKLPPRDLASSNYIVKKNKKEAAKSQMKAKRNAYMLCIIYEAINRALVAYKQRMCGGPDEAEANYDQTIVFNGF